MDLDETILDNSKYQAWLIDAGEKFTDATWDAWCEDRDAGAVPGAKSFVRYARSLDVAVVFITSRAEKTRKATVDNLLKLGVIQEAEQAEYKTSDAQSTLLFMKGMSAFRDPLQEEKFQQRQHVQSVRGMEILLSVGDNLGDYAAYYKKLVTGLTLDAEQKYPQRRASATERRLSADQDAPQWGMDFIVLPNCSYGDWQNALSSDLKISADGSAIDPASDKIIRWRGPMAKKASSKSGT